MYTEISNSEILDSFPRSLVLHKFPSTIQLLSQGGDSRIAVSGLHSLNRYGCSPFPNPDLLAFGSSTASVISDHAFSAADELRDRIASAIDEEAPEEVYLQEMNRIRKEFLKLNDLDNISNLQMIFGASGTDIHLIAAQITNSENSNSKLIIMPEHSETGSGVPTALSSRHFSNRSALGDNVIEGNCVEKSSESEVISISMRYANGNLRPTSIVDAEVEALVKNAVDSGRQVLLILVDTSKTGLISPSLSCAMKLKQTFPEFVNVLVDACQFRISSHTLREYISNDFMVTVTGSKFLTGPVFSGALLIPESVSKKHLSSPISVGIRAYSSKAEWPMNSPASVALKNRANFGLMLRWEAALEELRQFKTVPETQITSFMKRFSNAVVNRLENDDHFSYIPTRKMDRYSLNVRSSWDDVPSIFSFALCRSSKNGIKETLSHEETVKVHELLRLPANDPRRSGSRFMDRRIEPVSCQLGQPVVFSSISGKPTSALRMCLSSRLIVEACSSGGKKESEVIGRALLALDNLAEILK